MAAGGRVPGAGAAPRQSPFGTNWVAEGEHGGFYQALADGTYRKHGLDVTIVPGGPNVNNRILLPVGKIDFFLSANTLQSFDAVAQTSRPSKSRRCFRRTRRFSSRIPTARKFADLKNLTLFVSRKAWPAISSG